jgi:hypothetical protein
MKKRGARAPLDDTYLIRFMDKGGLDLLHIHRLETFGAFVDFELHLVVFFQGAKTLTRNIRVMHENVGAILPLDEPVALGFVEPLTLPVKRITPPAAVSIPSGGAPRCRPKKNGRPYGPPISC